MAGFNQSCDSCRKEKAVMTIQTEKNRGKDEPRDRMAGRSAGIEKQSWRLALLDGRKTLVGAAISLGRETDKLNFRRIVRIFRIFSYRTIKGG